MAARSTIPIVIVLLLTAIVACAGSDSDTPPSVKIISPHDQYVVTLGETLQVESRVRDDGNVARVELRVGNTSIDTNQAPDGEKSYRIQQSWTPAEVGSYTLTVMAFDDREQPSEPAKISVNVVSGLGSPVAPLSVAEPAPSPTTVPSVLPDLDVIDVQGNLDLSVGEPLALHITVRNQGPGPTDKPALIRLTLGDGTTAESYAPPLPAGGHVVAMVSLSHVFDQEAELTVVVAVDPEGEINEIFEDNNTTSVRMRVTSP